MRKYLALNLKKCLLFSKILKLAIGLVFLISPVSIAIPSSVSPEFLYFPKVLVYNFSFSDNLEYIDRWEVVKAVEPRMIAHIKEKMRTLDPEFQVKTGSYDWSSDNMDRRKILYQTVYINACCLRDGTIAAGLNVKYRRDLRILDAKGQRTIFESVHVGTIPIVFELPSDPEVLASAIFKKLSSEFDSKLFNTLSRAQSLGLEYHE